MNRIASNLLLVSLSLTGCQFFPEPRFEGSFTVPPGFVVEVAAPPEMVGSLIQLTFDSLGRPVVSKERGHPTILFDNDDDGLFETEKVFSDKVQNLQGMWFDGRTLYAIGDDSAEEKAGLYKLEDTNGDDVADTFERLHLFTGPMGEHGPHDIRRGPDGNPTVLVGNHSGVPEEMIDPASPLRGYKESQLLPRYMDARGHAVDIWAPGGAIFRLNLAKMTYSRLLGGFRNPYNHAYNGEGEMFTYDSDMEWDINLPWYREVRSVHAVPGADYGWRTGSGKFPAYYLDTLPPVDDLGRGSPVGVEFYHHYVYPEDYFDAFLQGDWSRGRVVYAKYERDGATYKLAGEPFDFIYGEPLNVTDLEVGPDGYVYFTMGGRGTAGGFYRVAYRGYNSNRDKLEQQGVMAAIRQPQPLSSWGHAALLKKKEEMGEAWGTELERVARDTKADSRDRVQALTLLQRFAPKPNADLLRPLSQDPAAAVRAAAVYVVGQHGSDRAKAIAAAALKDGDPLVRRRAAEAVVRMGLSADQPSFAPIDDLYALVGDSDRFARYAGRLALERTPRDEWKAKVLAEGNPLGALEGMVALIRTNAPGGAGLEPLFEKQIALFKKGLGVEDELRLLRVFHLTCLEIEQGCRPELRRQVYDIIAPRFPAQDERLNREYARTMAYADAPEAIEKIMTAMPRKNENEPLQIHYVYCLKAIHQGWTGEQKQTLLAWFGKAKQWRGGASFPGFINRLFDSSLEFFDDSEKQIAYNAIPEFAPLSESELDDRRVRRRGNFTPAAVFARQRGVVGVSEQEIFEYLMYDPMTLKANASEGRDVFEKECSKCHRFGGLGKDFGPDLTTIANRFTRKDLIEAVLWPSKVISDQYEGYIVETKGGDLFLGMVQSEDDEKIVMLIADEERPVVIPKSDVKDKRVSNVSTMPTQLLDGYSMGDISNLFAFVQKAPQ
jgi:putative heme-binding domain-containing protein